MNVKRCIVIWLLMGCILLFFMVMIGGVTRLTGSGLSIVDWRFFKDNVYPSSELDWQALFDDYKRYPEYQKKNINYTVQEFKNIFFWEYLHRLLGKIIGAVFFIPFLVFLVFKHLHRTLLIRTILLMLMGAFQGYLGWWMVKSGLIDYPDVSHYRLSIHLTFALITYSFTFWVMLNELFFSKETPRPLTNLSKFLAVYIILVFVQITYGGFVAGLDAGKIFNTWPKMGENWLPYVSELGLKAITSNRALVQFIHRCIAVIILLMPLGYFYFNKARMSLGDKKRLLIVIFIVLLQFIIGVCTLLFSVPITLGIVHQTMAFVLLSVIIYSMLKSRMNHRY